jgi:formylglycine-generating enzyme required for sulfatase activity
MLAMLFSVWLQRRQLPQNRGDLFRRFVDTLLIRERLYGTADGDRLLKGLAELAWRMQRERIARREAESAEDFSVLTVVSLEATLDCLGSDFLLKKALDATLLEGVEQLRFRHQLLQEYFTARALLAERSSLSASELWPLQRWWERSGWEESVVLLAGFFEEDCGEVIRWVGEAQPEVAAQCIEQSGAEIANKDALLHEFQSAWLPRLTDIQLEPSPEARAAIGRALARLNLDHRKGVSVGRADGVPDVDWVEIEGGEFIYQQGERRTLETFRMARYPVTNGQWQAFLHAGDGYANDRWWEGLTNPDRQPEKSTWIESNHPVTDVSWFEAVAFCRWLTEKLGLPVRLPTEWEWERAARGRNGREYPWEGGYRKGFANIDETERSAGPHYLKRTSPVGMYPQGRSEHGVCDLAGNVWEWCLNEYSEPNRCQVEGESARVLRGGSWFSAQDGARAEYRYVNLPDDRNLISGFRVVVSSPIEKRWRRKR